MPRLSRTIFVSLFIFSSLLFAVGAQSPAPQTSLEKAQNDYIFQFTKYRDAYEKYTNSKAEYETFKTAIAKYDAYVKTKEYLVQVDKLHLAYIAQTKEYGTAINWTKNGAQKNESVKILDLESQYLNSHILQLSSSKTLEDFPPLAAELKKNLSDDFQPQLNKVAATYELVEVEAALYDFTNLSVVLDKLVAQKLQAGSTNSIFANWSSEIKDIGNKTQNPLVLARSLLEPTKNTLNDFQLRQVTDNLNVAKDQIRRSKPLFKEIVEII